MGCENMKTAPGSTPQILLCGLRGLLCLGLITFIVLGAFFWLPANVNYHVTERYIFSSDSEDTLVFLGVMLPKSGPYQWVSNIEVSWHGVQQEVHYGFADVIKLTGEMSTQEKLEATIEYDVQLPQGPASWVAPVESFQRLPQTGIESDSQCLREQALDLCEGISTRDVYEIYSFTAEHMTYSRENCDCTNASALKAYEVGSSACPGYARLMTALCRASGIPSQMVIGLVYPDPMYKSALTSFPANFDEGHAWVEYYSEGSWKMADPTWGAGFLKSLEFNRNDGRHLFYGELVQVLSVNDALRKWAFDRAEFVLGSKNCFRYIATSKSEQISFAPSILIQRGWDGRWGNTLVIWVISTLLTCKYRSKIIGIPRQNS